MFTTDEINKAIAIRHDIHKHPEIRYEENRTSKIVSDILKNLGYEVIAGIAGTGVVGLLDTGIEGPCIAFRADMDGLPILENTGLDYASVHDGKMHACGHDGHTATLLLVAKWLVQNINSLKGKIKLIFQPAEEGGNGAEKMVQEGVLLNPKVECIFAFHNMPGLDLGSVYIRSNTTMAGNDTYELKIKGKAGHAAMPNHAIDTIYIGSNIIQQMQGLVARSKSPLNHGVISVTKFHAGNADNVIADTTEMTICVRNDGQDTYDKLVGQLENLIRNNCATFGAEYELKRINHVPPTINPPEYVDIVMEAAAGALLQEKVHKMDNMPTLGAEDFAFFLQAVPGCYFFVGNGLDSEYLHNEKYDFRDENIEVAASVFVQVAKHYCGR